MFLIDFDDTLFCTQNYKTARRDAVLACGVSLELWNETYAQARINENGHMVYSDKAHAKVLSQHGFSFDTIFNLFKKTTEHCQQWLFSDAIDFLNTLKKYNQPLILLSLGDADFQEAKVRGVGIHDYFDRLFMIPDSKIRVINELASATDIVGWLINDKINETKEIVAVYPSIRPVLKVSPKFPLPDYKASGLPFFEKLTEIGKYIQDNSAHISAGAVIYRKDENGIGILIMHRTNTGTYHLPKGTSEFGETIEETLDREVKEETNLTIIREQYLSIVDSTYVRDEKIKQKKTHYFLAQYKSGEGRSTDGEHDTVEFVPLEKALSLLQEKGAHLTLGFENEYKVLQLAKQKLTV